MPPVAAAYQFSVPAEAVAVRVVVPDTQTFPPAEAVMVGIVFTVTAVAADSALWQPLALVVLTV